MDDLDDILSLYGDDDVRLQQEVINLENAITDAFLDDIVEQYADDDPRLQEEVSNLMTALENSHVCPHCSSVIKSRYNYERHLKSHNSQFPCPYCQRNFSREDALKRHIDHQVCQKKSKRQKTNNDEQRGGRDAAAAAVSDIRPSSNQHPSPSHRTRDELALEGLANKHYIYPNKDDQYDLLTFLTNTRPLIIRHLQQRCAELKHIKYYINAQLVMERMKEDGIYQESRPHFRSKTFDLLQSDQITDTELDDAFRMVYKHFDEYNQRGSGWTLKRIRRLEVYTAKHNPLRAKSYFDLPLAINKKKALINIKNSDDKCFMWDRFPSTISQIPKFEQQNNISINVLGFEEDGDDDKEGGHFYPLYASRIRDALFVEDLLYITRSQDSHYVLIKNLNRLLAHTRSRGRGYHFCRYCLQGFTSPRILKDHLKYCATQGCQSTSFPTPNNIDNILSFKDFRKQMRVGFCIYADFKAFSIPVSNADNGDEVKFEACSYGYQVVSVDQRYTKPPKVYRGPNVVEHFLDSLKEEEQYIQEILSNVVPLSLSNTEEAQFQLSERCYSCDRFLTKRTGKVREHCHISGQYRGASCNRCNLQLKHPKFIPVVMHNLKNYDLHLLIQGVGKWKEEDISCILNSMERFLSISTGKLRFIDSCQFLFDSLETLVQNLLTQDNTTLLPFRLTRGVFKDLDLCKLMVRKGVFPYRYLDIEGKFKDSKLPRQDEFYNDLTKKPCSDEDYAHAHTVWDTFEMQTFGDYHDLYLMTDVLLLADVFESFRDMALKTYGLDPAHFYSAPGLAWQSALKYTKCRLQLLTDPNKYLFLEQGVRGGVSVISKRWAEANNRYMSDYDDCLPSRFLFLLDCNNLYGVGMSKPLPCEAFRWLSKEELKTFDARRIPDDSERGYVIECDLAYDSCLHDLHNDYPLAPEKMIIPDEMLSTFGRDLFEVSSGGAPRIAAEKLVGTLTDKTNYIVHYDTLKIYLQLGMKITKLHKVLEFKQRPFIKPYIDMNTRRRAQAKNDWERNFYKLMNNAVFGKTLENLRNRCDIRLVHNPEKFERLVARSSFKRFEIINEDLVAVELAKSG